MLTHDNLIAAVAGMLQIETYRRTDETLAYLPPAWIGDTFWSLAAALIVISQPLRLVIGNTHAWISFATWLTHWT